MADELQALLDRIKTEGIGKAEAESKTIIDNAKKEAQAIIAKANEEAAGLRKKAEEDANSFALRAEATARQAMRDVKLQLSDDLQKLVVAFLESEIKASLGDVASVKSWVNKAVETYLAKDGDSMEIELGGDAANVAASIKDELKAKAKTGIEITTSPAFPNGFTVRLDNGRVEQCFTEEAISSALERLLRPELAKLMKEA